MTEHRCPHVRSQHRHGSGRCLVAGCQCLQGPPATTRATLAKSARVRAITTVDSSGIVVEYKPLQSERERLERMLWRRIEEAGLPAPVKQFYWARPERMFRSDFAYVSERILVEVQGGIWAANPGRHNRGAGYQSDLTRANLAVHLGYRLLAFTEKMIRSGEAIDSIKRALEQPSSALQQMPMIGGHL